MLNYQRVDDVPASSMVVLHDFSEMIYQKYHGSPRANGKLLDSWITRDKADIIDINRYAVGHWDIVVVRWVQKRVIPSSEVPCALQWAQNSTTIFLGVKYASRWSAPGAIEVADVGVNITEAGQGGAWWS